MGSLSDLECSRDNEQSYYYAKNLMHIYDGNNIPPAVLAEIPEDLTFVMDWYDRLRHKETQKFVFYIPWCFANNRESINDIYLLCNITKGLSCRIRQAKEEDFFIFHPKEMDGDVLEISNKACYIPDELNLIFGNVTIDDPNNNREWTYMTFHW